MDIPNEIFLIIFTFLNSKELLKMMSICKDFQQLIMSKKWNQIVTITDNCCLNFHLFKNFIFSGDKLSSIPKKYHHAKHLDIYSNQFNYSDMYSLQYFENLRILRIYDKNGFELELELEFYANVEIYLPKLDKYKQNEVMVQEEGKQSIYSHMYWYIFLNRNSNKRITFRKDTAGKYQYIEFSTKLARDYESD
jgi:hypothetical protein